MEKIKLLMITAFLMGLLVSFWKIYAFLPKKQLEDDDTTPEATQELLKLMATCIIGSLEANTDLTNQLLYEQMITHETFDKKHFWRFNQNRLNQLLRLYYVTYPATYTLRDIYDREKQSCLST